ncbi:glutamine synthetase family protein [Yinghuangia seranimata]|uniref:glutamine synthetase family protein n=1 Tax=Yinghuangia seranimata TaxID=408067 RepID=UPI00248C9715|nr:glutamine synthetase family protein [Yinghuangia seranimata]MDI2129816.1 glutamine synthetase family protein [Yinghuangia seranimata]
MAGTSNSHRSPTLPAPGAAEARAARGLRADGVAAALRDRKVVGVAVGWVDNAGITRAKAVPVGQLGEAAAWGVGAAPCFDVFLVNDAMTDSRWIGGPVGDLRLVPDLDRITPLAAQSGWAWAPGDRLTQDGVPHPGCQRDFARRMVAAAAERGFEVRAGFETEWVVAEAGSRHDEPVFPTEGPAYGMQRVVDLSDYLADLLQAFDDQGLAVLQLHPEYAPGQFEVSSAAADPLAAADHSVLVRQTIRGVSARHDLRCSFAPVVTAGMVGNGGHLHLSLWRDGVNLMHGGPGPHGLTADAEAFLAGVLDALPALLAIGAPSVASYVRLVPSQWAGAFRTWGLENREAALRLITGSRGEAETRANAELKCFDAAANPYLLVGAVLAAGLDGVGRSLTLPPESVGDPARDPAAERLPQRLLESVAAFDRSTVLREALGDPLHDAVAAVRRGEAALFAAATPEEVVAATRWRY